MKKSLVCCMVLLVLCVFSASGLCNEVDSTKKQISDLGGYMAQLEKAYLSAMNEFQEVIQESSPIYAKARKILDVKKKDFTCEEALIIMTAAYYEQYLEKLVIALKFIESELYNTDDKIRDLKKKLEGMKEA